MKRVDGLSERADGWRTYHSGRGWRWREDRALEVEGHDAPPRTNGAPLTMRTLWRDYGGDIERAASRHNVRAEGLAALLACEAGRRGGYHLDARSRRHEPGYVSDEQTPRRVSVGLAQTLISTAREVAERLDLWPGEHVDAAMLEIPSRSIELGAGYLRLLAAQYGTDDPLLLQAGYNAGRIRRGDDPFHLYVFDNARSMRFARYLNDLVLGVWA